MCAGEVDVHTGIQRHDVKGDQNAVRWEALELWMVLDAVQEIFGVTQDEWHVVHNGLEKLGEHLGDSSGGGLHVASDRATGAVREMGQGAVGIGG
jgi:hypothetical protein